MFLRPVPPRFELNLPSPSAFPLSNYVFFFFSPSALRETNPNALLCPPDFDVTHFSLPSIRPLFGCVPPGQYPRNRAPVFFFSFPPSVASTRPFFRSDLHVLSFPKACCFFSDFFSPPCFVRVGGTFRLFFDFSSVADGHPGRSWGMPLFYFLLNMSASPLQLLSTFFFGRLYSFASRPCFFPYEVPGGQSKGYLRPASFGSRYQ